MRTVLGRTSFTVLFAFLLGKHVMAQCPQLYDYNGAPSSAPLWYSCSGTNFTLLIASPSSIGAYTIDWGDGSPNTSGASLVSPQSESHIYPATVGQYTITFSEAISGCTVIGTLIMEESTSASIQIPVGGLTQVCAPQAVDFVNSSTNVSPTTVFTWDFGDGSPLQTFGSTNLGQVISHTYMPGTVGCETTVMLSAENTCNTLQGGPSMASFNPIRVWDLDSASIAASATLLCWPDRTVTFLNTTDRNCLQQGNIYQRFEYWNFGDYWGTGQDSIIDWSPWPPTFPRTIMYPAIGSYEVMLLDSNYCGVDTAFITITIVPPPSITLTVDPDTICAGGTAFFQQTTLGGANYYQWDFGTGNGFQWTGAGDQAFTYTQPGNYIAQYTASIQGATAGCADTAAVQVVVLPSPTAQFSLDNDAACNSLTVTITNSSVNGLSQVWDLGDGTFSLLEDPPPHTYSAVGDYTIVLTVTNSDGCASTTSQVVHVYASPQVIIGAQNVCVGTAAQFTDLTVTAAGNPVVQWAWDFGDGSTDTLQSPTHLYAAAGIYTVSLLATTPYCSNSGMLQVTVEALPVAGFVPSDAYGCSPFNVSFANTSAGAVTQQWSFGDGATSNAFSPAHTYMNTGPSDTTFTVVLVVSTAFGCTDTTVSTITVAPAAVAFFTHNGIPGCAPLAVDFTNLSTGASAYVWSFGDGATSTAFQPSHTYVNNTLLQQVDTVTLVVISPGGCSDTTTQTVVVYPTADLNFISLPDSGCTPLEVTFSPVVGAVTFQWDLGDGSTSTSVQPVHTYVNAGLSTVVYPVTLVAGNAFGCQDTAFATVLVYPSPLAQFTPSAISGCQPLPITFTDQSIGAVNLEWHFGDGSTQSGGVGATTHTYANPGAVPLALDVLQIATSAFGCLDTAVVPIQVFPLLQAAFSAPPEGCSPWTLQLNDVGAGGSSWQWDMGDGTVLVGNGVTHTYVNNSTADITRTITLVVTSPYGCTDTLQQSVVVHPVTNAAFFATPLIQQFPSATVTVVNNTPNGAWSYAWDFGDGTVSALEDPLPHTYGTWGQYTITLVVISGTCTDTLTQPVEITPPMPTASFIGAGEGCQPLTVSFTNTSLLGLTYLWNFGDGGTSTADSPTYTWNQPGTYAVSVTAFGLGGTVSTAVKIDSVIVHPRAVAYFVLQPDEVVVPSQPVFTYNLSANATDHLWDFGDGVTSTELNPQHLYSAPGVFDVMLIANNQWDCPDTFRVQGAVTGRAAGDLVFPNAFTPSNTGPTDGVYDPASFSNDYFFPVFEGVEAYKLQVFNRWGEVVFESTDITIGWDGYYRDQPAKQDVYAWKAYARFSDGRETTLAGDVTLLR